MCCEFSVSMQKLFMTLDFRSFKQYGSFLGKFPKKPVIVEFPKSELFNRKFRKVVEENQMGRQFLVRKYRKFRDSIYKVLSDSCQLLPTVESHIHFSDQIEPLQIAFCKHCGPTLVLFACFDRVGLVREVFDLARIYFHFGRTKTTSTKNAYLICLDFTS